VPFSCRIGPGVGVISPLPVRVEGLTLLGGPRQATMSAGCMQIAVTSARILARPRRCAWLVDLRVTVVPAAVTMPSAQLD
jgi:hypothetical protein